MARTCFGRDGGEFWSYEKGRTIRTGRVCHEKTTPQLKTSTMNRRDFIKTIPLLTVASLVLNELSDSPKTNKRYLIALGSAASLITSKYRAELSFDSFTMIDRKLPSSLDIFAKFFQFMPPDSLYEQLGERFFLRKPSLPILPLSQVIDEHLGSLEGELVFLVALGKGTGSLLTQSIASHYINHFQKMDWLCILPFEFEGMQIWVKAQQALRIIMENGRDPNLIHLDEIRDRYGNLSIRSAFEKGEKWVLAELSNQQRAL